MVPMYAGMLRTDRQRRGFTVGQVAWRLGVSPREYRELEAAHRLAGDYEQDIADYEAVHLEILHMADMLSRGIIRQFPEMFV